MDFSWLPYMNGFWMFPLFCPLFMAITMIASCGMWFRFGHRTRSGNGRETVPQILELEWVLRYVADQPEDKVLDCLAHLIALPGITVEDRDEIEAALRHCRNGIDFADALHLAASKSCSEVLTFDDRGYARRAKKLRLKPPVRVPNR